MVMPRRGEVLRWNAPHVVTPGDRSHRHGRPRLLPTAWSSGVQRRPSRDHSLPTATRWSRSGRWQRRPQPRRYSRKDARRPRYMNWPRTRWALGGSSLRAAIRSPCRRLSRSDSWRGVASAGVQEGHRKVIHVSMVIFARKKDHARMLPIELFTFVPLLTSRSPSIFP
jgi:hypothetical protein